MSTNATTISAARPDRISLDYERLRAEGIRHLEELATEVWTDFNAHDPGITTLEVLCYALTDLAYRTNLLPISDLATTPDGRKVFFEPAEILPCGPVTARDYRKLLIDVPGVKNAWVEVPDAERLTAKKLIFKNLESTKTRGELETELLTPFPDQQTAIAAAVDIALSPDVLTRLASTPDSAKKILDYILCHHGATVEVELPNSTSGTPFDGIYKITLDLEDDTLPVEATERDETVAAAMATLHAHRGLGQDFAPPVVLDREDLGICLDLELENGADERAVLAQVVFNLQEYLTPTVHFHSLREMRARGHRIEDIFNGPLLRHGFLNDQELDTTGARPLNRIQRSDLFRVAKNTPGVRSVRDIQLSWFREGVKYQAKWAGGVFENGSTTENNVPWAPQNADFKFWLDVDRSEFCVHQGVRSFKLPAAFFAEQLAKLRLLNNGKINGVSNDPGSSPMGLLRTDLGHFDSIQHDFPANYRLGDHVLLPDAPVSQSGPMHQMQAYLLFYDQILAAYLRQLGEVGRLLAVEQDPAAPTLVLPALLEVPGARQLLSGKAEVALHATDWDLLFDAWEKLRPKGDTPTLELTQKSAFDKEVKDLQQHVGKAQVKVIFDLENAVRDTLGAAYVAPLSDLCWERFVSDPASNYRQSLLTLAEGSFERQERRNSILDHLLARFGEQFSTYVASLIRADVDPEDNPGWLSFDDYLRDKALFLSEVPGLGARRGLGLNYRAFSLAEGRPDVWNANNIPGLKRRVSRLLGLDLELWESKSLLAQPEYVLETVSLTGPTPRFQVVFRQTGLGTEPLLRSVVFKKRSDANNLRDQLFQNIDYPDGFTVEDVNGPNGASYQVLFTPKGQSKELLTSTAVGELSATNLAILLKKLVQPAPLSDFEGFHVVEHLLLRPNDSRDKPLQIPLGSTHDNLLTDPYSHWITVVAPTDTRRFKNEGFREQFRYTVRSEAPAALAIRFCWVDRDTLHDFEAIFKNWLEEKARCSPDECHVTDAANDLIDWLNNHSAESLCDDSDQEDCGC